jgi:hypothetical protein
MSAPRLPQPTRTVAVNLRDRSRYPWLAGISLTVRGLILEDPESGTRVRIRDDGSIENLTEGGDHV